MYHVATWIGRGSLDLSTRKDVLKEFDCTATLYPFGDVLEFIAQGSQKKPRGHGKITLNI